MGILPATKLPTQVPQHPECDAAEEPISDEADGADTVMTRYTPSSNERGWNVSDTTRSYRRSRSRSNTARRGRRTLHRP